MQSYYRPLPQIGPARPVGALPIAGGWCWFTHAERLSRGARPEIIPARELPPQVADAICAARPPVAGLGLKAPRLMGIVNTTPDSFSDGGRYMRAEAALAHGLRMAGDGADILDIGGESTRPGAREVPVEEEISRTIPVISALGGRTDVPVSIDTRKAAVARAALEAGAEMVNDVSGFDFDPDLAGVVAGAEAPVCLMHARGTPRTMQDNPVYDDVLLDVYDHLAERIARAEAAGIARGRIIVDPGIGFGKTLEHNLALLRGLSLFHALGCPLLLGVSRKRFIDALADVPDPGGRLPGSLAAGLAGVAQGVQILRVHDIAQTRQALTVWSAATGMGQ